MTAATKLKAQKEDTTKKLLAFRQEVRCTSVMVLILNSTIVVVVGHRAGDLVRWFLFISEAWSQLSFSAWVVEDAKSVVIRFVLHVLYFGQYNWLIPTRPVMSCVHTPRGVKNRWPS